MNASNVLIGMVAGLELSIVHLANILVSKGVSSREGIAASFRETASAVEKETRNRDIIVMILDHVAAGIEGSRPPDPESLFRLIKGGKKDPSAP